MKDDANRSPDWRLRNVRWAYVFSRQDYANIACSILLVIALALMHWVATPRHPVFYLYDATISYPFIGNPTVPSWVPILIPFLMLIFTVVIGELVYSKRQHHSLTDCLATMVYFLLDGVQAFVFTIFMTVLTKLVCGRLRPDFLARCNPNLSNVSDTVQLAFGQDITSQYPCQSSGGELEDGYMSFPSGHASTGFSLTVYASAYLIWCFHMRKPWNPDMRNWAFKRKFLSDFGNILAKYWMLAMLMFSWGVALSRTIDYQHNYSDIVGGAFLGTLVAVVYALRAIPRYRRVLSPEALEDAKALEEAECAHAEHAEHAEHALLDGGHSSLRRTRSGKGLRQVVVTPTSIEA